MANKSTELLEQLKTESEDFRALVDWCDENNIRLRIRSCGVDKSSCSVGSSSINVVIGGSDPISRTIAIILHELGHASFTLEGRDGLDFKHGYYASHKLPKYERSFAHRMTIVQEELDAWDRGWQLSERMGLRQISAGAYFRIKAEYCKQYFEWALRAKTLLSKQLEELIES